jgi:hypothetical protein
MRSAICLVMIDPYPVIGDTGEEMDRQNRAYAIFASTLNTDSAPNPGEVRDAVTAALRRHRDVRGCIAAAAHAFGAHPEAAARRMRWALALAHGTPTGPRRTRPARPAATTGHAQPEAAAGAQPRVAAAEACVAALLAVEQFPRAAPVVLLIYLALLPPHRPYGGIPLRRYGMGTARH